MYKVAVEQTDANKITPVKGDTLASIAASATCEAGTTWQHLALYNWGTIDPFEVNRALIELVGCSTVDDAAPEKSVIDPDLGTTKALHVPKTWPMPAPLPVEKTHTVKLRRRRPPPAAVLTKVDPWFIPEAETCDIGWRIEGHKVRADKLDFDVYASNYCKATPTLDQGFMSVVYAALDIPIRQKRAFEPADERKTGTIGDWKGESEAADGMLKPRDKQKRHVDVSCSPYTVLLRYYKVDDDKDARVTLKTFWPRFKKVWKDGTKTQALDADNAGGLKGKTEAALTAARELQAATAQAELDAKAFVEISERAAVRAHAASKASAKAVTDLATARTALDKSKTDAEAAVTALTTKQQAAQAVKLAPTDPAKQQQKTQADSDYTTKSSTAEAAAKDARTKAKTAHDSVQAASDAAAVAKAAAAQAATAATAAKTSVTAAVAKAGVASIKADEAKSAAAAAPDTVTKPAAVAAEQGKDVKKLADKLTPIASAFDTTAATCKTDAAAVVTNATAARDESAAMFKKAGESVSAPSWPKAKTASAEAVTKAEAAKTKSDLAKPQAETAQTSADAARTDSGKLIQALDRLKAAAAQLVTDADATDDHVVYDASLQAAWKVEKSTKLKRGQLLIVDKTGKPIFRKPLAAADLTPDAEIVCKPGDDDQAKYWLDKKTKLHLSLSGMPYRLQLQVHSDWDEDDGVALVAMHTEVRLWAHKDNGLHVNPLDDSQSLHFGIAPWRPEKKPPAQGSHEWYRLKLAEGGFHPGPVNPTAPGGAADDPLKVALGEFQRSYPKEKVKPFTRLTSDGQPNGPTRDVMERTDSADQAMDRATDIKADTAATLTAANTAKTSADAVPALAAAAQKNAVDAVTLVDEAVTAAVTAAADAAAATKAFGKALSDVKSADTLIGFRVDSLTATARVSAASARTAATTALSSAAVSAAKGRAARDAAAAYVASATTAKTAIHQSATDADAAQAAADKAKTAGTAAAASVKSEVDACASVAATAQKSALASKSQGDAGVASGTTAGARGDVLLAAVEQDHADAKALDSQAAALVVSVTIETKMARSRGAAGTAKESANAAMTAANQAVVDAQALKALVDQARIGADQVKADADQAALDAAALVPAAQAADDAAEADRLVKQTEKAAVDKIYRPHLPIFGNVTTQADHALTAVPAILSDKAQSLAVWVNDRHYYTESDNDFPELAMGDYRGGMSLGDAELDKDAASVARPWIPLEVHLPLLGKADALDATGSPPAVTDEMRRAIGPLRVDWSFDELPVEMDHVPVSATTTSTQIADFPRGVSVKAKTAAALTAANDVKPKATPLVTKAATMQTEHARLATAAKDAAALADQATRDVAAALKAADKAAGDVAAAAQPAATPEAKKTARASCADASAKAAAALQSATQSAAKVVEAKTAAGALSTAADAAKTEATTLDGEVDTVRASFDEADVAISIAASSAAVTGPFGLASQAVAKARTCVDTTVKNTATADTSATTCKNESVTADTAAALLKTQLDTLKATVDLLKQHADADRWGEAATSAAQAGTQAADAKTSGDQARKDLDTLATSVTSAKADVDQAKKDADAAKIAIDAIAGHAKTADDQAEVDRLARDGPSTTAASSIDPQVARSLGQRPRAWLANAMGRNGFGREHDGKLYTNCPDTLGGQKRGGIRPEALDTYYKTPFGLDKPESNRPWLGIDDTANKVVSSVVHDDLGQDKDEVFDAYRGKAGMFFHPSRVAGDGYRVRAQLSFRPLPAAASHPNQATLLERYVRPPAAHTAALRVWRKTSFRGYVRWTPAAEAGWENVLDNVRDIYHPARVHFVHDGPDAAKATEYPLVGPGALITAAEYQAVVNSKTKGTYKQLQAVYDASYIWPYMDRVGWGIPDQPGDLAAMQTYLYGTLQNHTWRAFRAKLLHLIVKKIENENGRMKGHLLVDFKASAKLVLNQYACTVCKTRVTQVANDPAGTVVREGQNSSNRLTGTACPTLGCAGTYAVETSAVWGGIPLAAVGCAFGATWLFTPRDAMTWAHELGHHRHLQHAQANTAVAVAPGGQTAQHDAAANAAQANAAYAHQKAWDRWCLMSYDDKGPQHFCGKCVLKNAGWLVDTMTNADPELQDG